MNYNLNEVYKHLTDEESRLWLDARIRYAITRDNLVFYKDIYKINKNNYWGAILLN